MSGAHTESPAHPSHPSTAEVWAYRARVAGAILVGWGLLRYGVDSWFRGYEQPLVLLGSSGGVLAAAAALVFLPLIAWLGAACGGARDRRDGYLVLGFAIALWTLARGGGDNINAWLERVNVVPGPPRGAPYVWLLLDYVVFLVAGAAAIVRLHAGSWAEVARGAAWSEYFRGYRPGAPGAADGWKALAVATLVAAAGVLLLNDRVEADTRRGQVVFAVVVGFLLGVSLAYRLTRVTDIRWYWPAPFAIGMVGMLVAAVRPDVGIPGVYALQNVHAAWNLARPLPSELIGVGLIAIVCALRSLEAGAGVVSGEAHAQAAAAARA